jgi:hypothetical protein
MIVVIKTLIIIVILALLILVIIVTIIVKNHDNNKIEKHENYTRNNSIATFYHSLLEVFGRRVRLKRPILKQ